MDSTAARVLMGDSLGFHIIFAALGVGLPLVLLLGELYGIKTKKQWVIDEVKKLSRIATLLVVAGVASGTIIAIQMQTIWPYFMKIASPVVGPAFLLEGYAFLFEAIFLAFYLLSWKKIKGYKHALILIPIVLGALMSATFITMVNSWMSYPTGFTMGPQGLPENINHLEAMFTASAFFKIAHSVLAYYAASVLLVAMGYIIVRLRTKDKLRREQATFIAKRLLAVGVIIFLGIMTLGDLSASYLAESEPRKLAAYEAHYRTQSQAPYYIGGYLDPDTGETKNAIRIPYLLSFLAGKNPDFVVQGLEDIPRHEWPPLYVHTMFDIKMALAITAFLATLAIPLHTLLSRYKKFPRLLAAIEKPLWIFAASAGILSMIIIILGWAMTEIARQPWTITGVLTTADAATKDHNVMAMGIIFPLMYVALFTATGLGLRALLKQRPNRGISS